MQCVVLTQPAAGACTVPLLLKGAEKAVHGCCASGSCKVVTQWSGIHTCAPDMLLSCRAGNAAVRARHPAIPLRLQGDLLGHGCPGSRVPGASRMHAGVKHHTTNGVRALSRSCWGREKELPRAWLSSFECASESVKAGMCTEVCKASPKTRPLQMSWTPATSALKCKRS